MPFFPRLGYSTSHPCSPAANYKRIQEAHKRIMISNHPDRGGSPYLAAKINEAKELLDKFHSNRT